MKSINIQYEKLVQDYLESLNTQLRGFSPSKELDFLETWTPDDNITYSILSIIECAYESELKELSIILNSKSKDRIGPFSFDIVFGFRKTISADYTFDGFKLYSGITTYLQGW